MADTHWIFNDQEVTEENTIADLYAINQVQLLGELQAVNANVVGLSVEGDQLNIWVDENWTSQNQSALDAVIAAHTPIQYETAPRKQYSGTTDANGELAIEFVLPYRTQPEMYMETPQVEGQSNYVLENSKSTTGCTCLVTEQNSTFVALVGLTLVEPNSPVQGAHVTLTVFNNDL